ncbi:hypothetical protein A1OQ_09170 [Enterovibrio norvegicus FF-162]|uniref:antiviral reverse transcriptase Drt3a n=1 Tax=Enterovibrio norvegicus TaxID=188144 RepID=UPI0002E0044B|nr:antiviral reverse transcriptase Drt3a [Enterovibrio norvegicus]OEE74428.1 hypothetical protein A1OQ_09170 [Enterovibrio norvegicus FF-162]
MLDQSFSHSNLKRLIKNRGDNRRFGIGFNPDEIEDNFLQLEDLIKSEDFEFELFKKYKFNNKIFYWSDSFTNEFSLRKANDNIRRLYKISQSDRGKIIKQTKKLLEEETPKYISRLDITSFYESVDKGILLDSLLKDPLPSLDTKNLILKLLTENQFKDRHGLPRGLSISATLSEYYLRDFDQFVNNLDGVYFYARYVDDIIIFSFKNPQGILSGIKKYLSKNKRLEINNSKSSGILEVACRCYNECVCNNNCKCMKTCKCSKSSIQEIYNLDYLGYKFSFPKYPAKEKLKIRIADKKIKKIKSRIVNSFIDFSKNMDFLLLEKRIKFLTGNHAVVDGEDGKLCSGIYYNYHLINNHSDLVELNNFLNSIIYSTSGYIGGKLRNKLDMSQKERLRKNSFYFGFESKILHKFKYNEIKEIKKAW